MWGNKKGNEKENEKSYSDNSNYNINSVDAKIENLIKEGFEYKFIVYNDEGNVKNKKAFIKFINNGFEIILGTDISQAFWISSTNMLKIKSATDSVGDTSIGGYT